MQTMLLSLTLVAIAGLMPADEDQDTRIPMFQDPVRLKAGNQWIQVEAPGWACPSWVDMNGDGYKDLLVGQFAGGRIRVYHNLGYGQLDEGRWLQADGKNASVPGVW